MAGCDNDKADEQQLSARIYNCRYRGLVDDENITEFDAAQAG